MINIQNLVGEYTNSPIINVLDLEINGRLFLLIFFEYYGSYLKWSYRPGITIKSLSIIPKLFVSSLYLVGIPDKKQTQN